MAETKQFRFNFREPKQGVAAFDVTVEADDAEQATQKLFAYIADLKRQVWSDLKQVRAKLDALRQAQDDKGGNQPEQGDLFGTLPVL